MTTQPADASDYFWAHEQASGRSCCCSIGRRLSSQHVDHAQFISAAEWADPNAPSIAVK
jgi:hypothetical protein